MPLVLDPAGLLTNFRLRLRNLHTTPASKKVGALHDVCDWTRDALNQGLPLDVNVAGQQILNACPNIPAKKVVRIMMSHGL